MKIIVKVVLALFSFAAYGQVGGEHVYEFLNISNSARVAALGGNQIAVKDDDVFLGFVNPSLLNSEMDNKFAFTYTSYLDDINTGFASYTKDFDSLGTFSIGMQYIDYGDFIETDNAGNEIGNFDAGEYAFIVGYAYQIDSNFSVGGNLKTIFSSFYDNNSSGLALDAGLTYFSEKEGLTVALLVKNAGFQLTRFENSSENEDLPFEVQVGASKRFANVPLRLGLIVQQIQDWDLTFDDPNADESQNLFDGSDNTQDDDGFMENLSRHLILNAEFLVSKNFNIRLGYNFLRRAELKVDEKLGAIGFTWGFGMRISKFHISYGRSSFHQSGGTNTFSVSTRFSDFIK